MSTSLINCDEFSTILAEIDSTETPAYIHGLISGFICSNANPKKNKNWLELIVGKPNKKASYKHAEAVLTKLYDATFENLQDLEFSFSLLLPSDGTDLRVRAEALSQFCMGFLAGLGLGGIDWTKNVSEENRETLFHISEIGKLDYEIITVNETDEVYFTEVYEYVRMSVIMFFTERARIREENIGNSPKK